jgi:hypothetical protein
MGRPALRQRKPDGIAFGASAKHHRRQAHDRTVGLAFGLRIVFKRAEAFEGVQRDTWLCRYRSRRRSPNSAHGATS